VTKIAPVAGMFVFAILFFGVVSDAGLLAPLVNGVLRLVGRRRRASRWAHRCWRC
jgi:CitMHS family citrate-Mg2+:H+ or citrate-Ca2+:H+ symporter